MERRFSLPEGRGWLSVRDGQGRVVCRGELTDGKEGIYKGWLIGAAGRALLGTFIPEGGVFRLSHTISLAELERQGAWPPVSAEAVLAYRFQTQQRQRPPVPKGWTWLEEPGRLLGEPLLARAAGKEGALLRREEDGFLLAKPFQTGRPFPLTPLFCFARIVELEGEAYAVFPFRAGGCPRLE